LPIYCEVLISRSLPIVSLVLEPVQGWVVQGLNEEWVDDPMANYSLTKQCPDKMVCYSHTGSQCRANVIPPPQRKFSKSGVL